MAHSKQYYKFCQEAYGLWVKYHGEYPKLLAEYERLLTKKRELDLDLGEIRPSLLRDEAPNIRILEIESEEELEDYLDTLEISDLMMEIGKINHYVSNNPARRTLKSKIFDYGYRIRMQNAYKSPLAMSPEACKCGKTYGHHTPSTHRRDV